MVFIRAIAINETFVLVFGTLTLLLVVVILIGFAFLFQRKLINKQRAFREVETLLQKQELKAAYMVLEAQELERKRIGEDLHDRLGSRLAAVKLHFHAFERNGSSNVEFFVKGSELLDGAVDEVREISHNLISGVLSKFGLIAALQDLKNMLETSKQIEVQLHVHHIENRLNLIIESNIYRIVQELVSNILKHSKATEIIIQLSRFELDILLIVEDNGIGFDLNSKNSTLGIGLKNVQSRVAKLNGKVNIDSRLQKGTVVTIEFPVSDDKYTDS